MPKWLTFGLVAVGQLAVAAAIFFNRDRVVIPVILAFAGLCMLIAAVGNAMGKG
jgi:hypothetical protein